MSQFIPFPAIVIMFILGMSPTNRVSGQVPDSLYEKAASEDMMTRIEGLYQIGALHQRNRATRDSARQYMEQVNAAAAAIPNQEYLARSYSSLSYLATASKQYDKGIAYGESGLEAAFLSGDSTLVGGLARRLGYSYTRIEKQAESYRYYQLAAQYFSPAAQPEKYVDSKINAALKLGKLGRYDEARLTYDTLLTYLDGGLVVKSKTRSKLFNSLATLYRNLKQYETAQAYGERALATKQAIGDRFGAMVALSTLQSITKQGGDFAASERYGLSALHLADSLNKPRAITTIVGNLGSLYTDLKQFAAAEQYIKRAIAVAESNRLSQSAGINWLNLSGLYLKADRLADAARAIEKTRTYLDTNDNLEFTKKFYGNLVKINEASKNYEAAFKNLKNYLILNDSLFSTEKSKTIAELDARYETAQKENKIALLTKDAELQVLANTQLQQQRGLLIGGGLALLLFAGVLVSRSRARQRALETIQQQHDEIEEKNRENELLVREVHHRVKNNMQIMAGLLQAQRFNHDDNVELGEALMVCEGQLSSMALIHQNLYRTNNFMSVNSRIYFSQLLEHLRSAYAERTSHVRFEITLLDYELQVVQAVPLGLILNELVTNAVKYAFPERRTDALIEIHQTAHPDGFVLAVYDNGKGLPEKFDKSRSSSFGMRLVSGLTKQIGGRIVIPAGEGARFEVVVPHGSPDTSEMNTSPAESSLERLPQK